MSDENDTPGGIDLPKMFKGMVEEINGSQAKAAQSRFHTGEHLAEFAVAALNSGVVPERLEKESEVARWVANVAVQLNEILLSHMAQQERPKETT